jgi:hypothetical protein
MRIPFVCTLLVFSAIGLSVGQDTNFATGPQYLMTFGSPYFARPISTPSISLAGPPLDVGASNATEGLVAGAENRIVPESQPDVPPVVNLFPIYYGEPAASVIEISFSEYGSELPTRELPASILDTGVLQATTVQALRERGYGVTVAEAASRSKATARHAPRIYTNDDIDRMHGRT